MNKRVSMFCVAVFFAHIAVASAFVITPRKVSKDLKSPSSIMAVINEIKKEQGINNVFEINPDKVSDRLLEKTGEALITSMPPNPREHEIMDSMIVGKKGLSSLTVVRRVMGYHYLTGDFYGGPGDLYGPSLLCSQAAPEPIKDYSFITFSARYLAFLWFLLAVLALTNIYLFLKIMGTRKGSE